VILKEVVNLSHSYRKWEENSAAERIRHWLSPLESESRLADILAKRAHGTGDSCLNSASFHAWRDLSASSPPGLWYIGQSMLSIHLHYNVSRSLTGNSGKWQIYAFVC
jgi:hypothetical protein